MIMAKQEYTVDIHKERLMKFIHEGDLINKCPSVPDFNGAYDPKSWWSNNPCKICLNFIDLTSDNYDPLVVKCPCARLGCKEALSKTLKALGLDYES